MNKIKTFIKPLSGREGEREFVFEIMTTHPEWYGDEPFDPKWMLNQHLYGIYNEEAELLGFFAIAIWHYNLKNDEAQITWVYIKPEYRKQGLFNKLVKFVKDKCYDFTYICIQAAKKNPIACEIYNRKFEFARENDEGDGYWYVVVNREKNN